LSLLTQRLQAQLLCGEPARGVADVARHLLAVQGQDGRGVRLAVRARTRGLTAADFDEALAAREVLITWLNRGTLHLVASEDHHWLHALTAPPRLTGCINRLTQLGVDHAQAERGVGLIVAALEDGPRDRASLGEVLAAAGVPTGGQALIHLLMLSSLRGLTVRGPMLGKQHAYVLTADWLGRAPRLDRGAALAELARRYLLSHAPADERDLARWAGLPLRDARAGLAAIASELVPCAGGRVALARAQPRAGRPQPRLLGAFEPVLLGWCSREDVLGAHAPAVVRGGMFHPFATVGGRAVATWAVRDGTVTLAPLRGAPSLPPAALAAEVDDVARFLGLARQSGTAPAAS
jgi:hypothetical protein